MPLTRQANFGTALLLVGNVDLTGWVAAYQHHCQGWLPPMTGNDIRDLKFDLLLNLVTDCLAIEDQRLRLSS
jgi:hypothetical protein